MRNVQPFLHSAALFVLALATATPGAQAPSSGSRPAPAAVAPPDTVWSLAATGDAIITRPIMQFDHDQDPAFRNLVKIVQAADAGFLNLELSLFRFSEFKGWPEVENGGNWEVGPPEVAADLKAMGFSLFHRANNHTTDYGVEGMRVTNQLLDQLGIVHAGTGMNLGQASRPGYLETPKGRIALISFATTFTPMSRAGAVRPEVPGRPGLNALRVETRYELEPRLFESLQAEATKLGGRALTGTADAVRLFGTTIRRGSATRVIYTPNRVDEERILREIRNASSLADYVVVSSHSHEPGNDSLVPADWLTAFAKKCLDAGAITFMIHGPHQLRGVDMYKGKPIFHSLGNFVFQNETIDPVPSDHYETYSLPDSALASDLYDARFKGGTTGFPSNDVWYQGVIAVPTFKGTRLVELKMYPLDLGRKAPRSQRGTPRLADEATGRQIIERLSRLSAGFGTTLVNEHNVAVWKPMVSGTK